MGAPSIAINMSNILRAVALRAGTLVSNNKFAVGASALSLGLWKVEDIVGNDTELDEYIEENLADGMTSSDKEEAKKSINFIANTLEGGIWMQPLKEGEVHRFLTFDFQEDKGFLTVRRYTLGDIRRAVKREREKWQYASTRKKR